MPNPPIDIPHAAPFLQKTFPQTHALMRVEPNDDPELGYELLIPKSWGYSREFGPVTATLLADRGIGFFLSAAEPGAPVIAAVATKVPYEIPIDAWARASFVHEGWTILEASWFPGPNGLYYDLTGTRVVDDVTHVRRTAVRVRGNYIFSLNCLTALEHWEKVKETFWLATTSFKLTVSGSSRMETWLEAKPKRAPHFKVAHPSSWLSEPVDKELEDVSAVDIRLIDANAETLLGYVQVKALHHGSTQGPPVLDELKDVAFSSLKRSGFATDHALDPLTEDIDARQIAIEGWLGGFHVEGTIGEGDIGVRLGFVERAGVVFTLLLLHPRLVNSPLFALRGIRAFEIARASLVSGG